MAERFIDKLWDAVTELIIPDRVFSEMRFDPEPYKTKKISEDEFQELNERLKKLSGKTKPDEPQQTKVQEVRRKPIIPSQQAEVTGLPTVHESVTSFTLPPSRKRPSIFSAVRHDMHFMEGGDIPTVSLFISDYASSRRARCWNWGCEAWQLISLTNLCGKCQNFIPMPKYPHR